MHVNTFIQSTWHKKRALSSVVAGSIAAVVTTTAAAPSHSTQTPPRNPGRTRVITTPSRDHLAPYASHEPHPHPPPAAHPDLVQIQLNFRFDSVQYRFS